MEIELFDHLRSEVDKNMTNLIQNFVRKRIWKFSGKFSFSKSRNTNQPKRTAHQSINHRPQCSLVFTMRDYSRLIDWLAVCCGPFCWFTQSRVSTLVSWHGGGEIWPAEKVTLTGALVNSGSQKGKRNRTNHGVSIAHFRDAHPIAAGRYDNFLNIHRHRGEFKDGKVRAERRGPWWSASIHQGTGGHGSLTRADTSLDKLVIHDLIDWLLD